MIVLNLQALWRRASSLSVRRRPCRQSAKPFTSGPAPALLRSLCLFAAVFLSTAAARAQDTNPPPPQYSIPSPQYSTTPVLSQAVETNLPSLPPPVYSPEVPPAPPLAGTRQLYVPSAAPLPALPPLLHSGPLALQTHLVYSLSYGNGLYATPGQQSKTVINEIDPGILFQWGNHWTLDYTPSLRYYSSSAFQNTFDNSVTLTGGTTYEDWNLGLSQSYASYSDPIIETGSQFNQETFSTGLSAVRQLGSKTSLELGANQNLRYSDQTISGQEPNNYNSWSTMDWLNYQFWSRFGAAVGVGFDYDNVKAGSDMTSEQIQGRITWIVVKKLSFVLSGGGSDRQFLGSGVPDLLSPIFSLSAQYSPFEVTTFYVSAYNAVTPSYYQDQVTESTSISAGMHQRLLGKLYLGLNGGYSTTSYHSSTLAPAAANIGNYDSTFLGATLSTALLKRGTAAIFYSVNYNSSGAAIYNYTTTMVGLQLSYRY
jgi:hypothetical protein